MLAAHSVSNYPNLVPIVLTSAVTGSGIGTLHALLHHLPLPLPPQSKNQPTNVEKMVSMPDILFHIDEIFTKPEQNTIFGSDYHDLTIESSHILSGHLRYGDIYVGNEIMIGPFAYKSARKDAGQPDIHYACSYPSHFRDGARNITAHHVEERPSSSGSIGFRATVDSDARIANFWQQICIVSIRNLRLPVQKLVADQVGTIGITFAGLNGRVSDPIHPSSQKIRKGMVLTQTYKSSMKDTDCLAPSSGFLARFDDDGTFTPPLGTSVVVYIASIRASAKVIKIKTASDGTHGLNKEGKGTDVFGFNDNNSDDGGVELSLGDKTQRVTEVAFRFLTCREWVEKGTQVLVMPERNERSSVGLEGFVGRITHAIA